jgi:hypothetical protein
MVGHTAAKRAQWQIEHELGKNEISLGSPREGSGDTVRGSLGRTPTKPQSDFRHSNRDQTQTPKFHK